MPGPRGVTLRFLAEPGHVNFGGKVHGGAVMKWIDQAGYTCAAGWAGQYCVTLYLGGLHFLRPIHVGEVVELRALVIHTGRTSLHIAIDIYAADPKAAKKNRCCHCVIVFVALNDAGRPVRFRPGRPRTIPTAPFSNMPLRLTELRKLMDSEMEAHFRLLEEAKGD